MQTDKSAVFAAILAKQPQIMALGVKRLGLFGSCARNQQRPDSDIDLLVEFEPGRKSFDNFMRLSYLLEDSLPLPVELVTAESLSPYLRPHILKEIEYVPFRS
jgi:predicted nucleotidyltransferase